MNGLPYYKAYPRDFIEGTIGMPFEIKCAYRVVLDLVYMQGGRLPDDARYISGLLGCSIRKWNSIRAALLDAGKIQTSGTSISNYRADKELETLSKLQDNQREKASRPRKNNGLQQPRLSQPEPEPEPYKEREEEEGASAPKPRRRSVAIPDGWVPNDRNVADAEARNFTAKEIQDEADRFRDYHTAKGSTYKDWDAAWRTWLGNARRYGGRMAGNQAPGGYGQGGSIASVVARRRAEGKV